jgi:hypothetical protein
MIWLRKYLCHKWPNNHGFVPFFTCCKNFPILSSIMTYHRVCNYRNMTGATSRTRTAYTSGTREFTSGFSWVRVARSLVFSVVVCRSLFVLLSFFVWPLRCLSFFVCGFWFITHLISSNAFGKDKRHSNRRLILRRTDNTMAKRKRTVQITIYKTLHR